MARRRVRAVVHGRVQGVFFRAYTQEEAERRGLRGWVRNRPEGTVETVLAGEEEAVAEMLAWLRRGSPRSLVERVECAEEGGGEEFTGFTVRY